MNPDQRSLVARLRMEVPPISPEAGREAARMIEDLCAVIDDQGLPQPPAPSGQKVMPRGYVKA